MHYGWVYNLELFSMKNYFSYFIFQVESNYTYCENFIKIG